MILYAESSAVAAWLLLEERAPAIRAALSGAEAVLASDLTYLESDRALRRAVEFGRITEAEAMARRGAFSRAAAGWSWMRLAPEILERARAAFPLEPVEPNYEGEVAERWRYRDGAGEIGVISSVTQAFCRDCNRIRLSTEGSLFTCLFASSGHDLRGLLRGGCDDAQLAGAVSHLWARRADRYSEVRSAETAGLRKIEMSYIGG
jgi:cyclic pyranopterin phosphate synthase